MTKYLKFGAMIATSTVVMLILMYLNTYSLDHVFFSETRLYMAFVMGATMAIVMLLFMLKMYENQSANVAILVGSVAVFALSLWLVRSQETVDDVSYMRAMIPSPSSPAVARTSATRACVNWRTTLSKPRSAKLMR